LLGTSFEISTLISIKEVKYIVFVLAARLEGIPVLPLRQFYLIMISIVINLGQGIGLIFGPIIYILCRYDIKKFLWVLFTVCILWSVIVIAFTKKQKMILLMD